MFEDLLKTEAQKKLADAFLVLYAEKPIKNITVKELTTKAGLNRSTFYLYYNDIYTMLEDLENNLIDTILPNIDIFLMVVNNQEDITCLADRLNYCKKYQPYFKSLLGINARSSFINKIKSAIKNYIMNKINLNNPQIIAEYIMEYIVSAHFGVITFWLSRDLDLPAEKMIEILSTIFTNGPYHILKENTEENIFQNLKH